MVKVLEMIHKLKLCRCLKNKFEEIKIMQKVCNCNKDCGYILCLKK